MRILIHSNAPWANTGYGQQTALLAPRLAEMGHEVAISAFWGLAGAPLQWDGINVYPSGQDPFGNDVLPGHAKHFGADLVLTLMDMWVLHPQLLAALPAACWMPVDTAPLGKPDYAVLTAADPVPVAMSRFGEDRLRDAGFRPCYVPHGIDTSVFTLPPDKDAAKAALGVAGKFVIGINAANKDAFRKAYPEQLAAFAAFHAKHPDTVLAVHALAAASGALDLRSLAAQLGILDAVMFASQYDYAAGMITPDMMAGWYGALDLYSGASFGEGFGIPLIEAQACGVPVVTTDASSMTELAGGGWTVPGQRLWNPHHHAWWTDPSITALTRVYEKAYTDRKALAARAAKARPFAVRYDIAAVMTEHWKPALDEIAERTAPKPMIIDAAGLRWHIGQQADHMGPSHEDSVEGNLLGLLPAGGVFLDIGAHVGHYTLRAAATASKVIAVEANPDTAAQLTANLHLNGITNVTMHNIAAWDEDAQLNLHSPNQLARDGSMRVLPGGGPVRGQALDGLLAGEDRIDLVKLDVEGADLHALRGLRATLARCRPVMFIEDHSIYGYYARADLDALISDLGYAQRPGGAYGGATYLIAEPAAGQPAAAAEPAP